MINTSAMPSVMEAKLGQIRRRQATLAVARALAISFSVLLAIAMLVMSIDWWLTLFDTGVRTLLTLGTLVASALAFFFAGWRPFISAFGWTRAAVDVDREVPQLEERWSTVASFAIQLRDPGLSIMGKALLQQVTSEAVAMERLVRPVEIAKPASLRPAMLALSGCLAVFGIFMAIAWPMSAVLVQRFLMPTANITATQLYCVNGDIVVPRGERVELVTKLTGLAKPSATLEIFSNAGVKDTFRLKGESERNTEFTHSMVFNEPSRYRVRAGDGQSKWHSINVIDFPALGEILFTVTPPEYVDRPPFEKPLIPNRVKALQGSQLSLQMKPVAELKDFAIELLTEYEENQEGPVEAPEKRVIQLIADADGWYRLEMQLTDSLSLSPALVSREGLTNESKQICRIQVIADQAPVARIISPTDEMAVTNDDSIEIQFEAHDDHGIASAELVIYQENPDDKNAKPKILSVQPIDLGEKKMQPHLIGSAKLELSQFKLDPGASISYSVRVIDNRSVTIAKEPRSDESLVEKSTKEARDLKAGKAPKDEGESEKDGTVDRPMSDTVAKSNPIATENLTNTDDGKRTVKESTFPKLASPISEAENSNDKALVAQVVEPQNPAASADGPSDATRVANATTDDNEKPVANKKAHNAEKTGTIEKAVASETEAAKPTDSAIPSSRVDASPTNATAAAPTNATVPNQTTVPSTVSAQSGSPKENAPPGTESDRDENARKMAAKAKDSTPASASKPSDRPPMTDQVTLLAQQSEDAQNTETKRLRLKITERLVAVARDKASTRRSDAIHYRDRIVKVEELLAQAEEVLKTLAERTVADADRPVQFRNLFEQLGEVEVSIADLRKDTKGNHYAFVGLQMVDIGRMHVTPARDKAFAAVREPLNESVASSLDALQHVNRAREIIASFLRRFDEVERDEKLAKGLQDEVKMYEVYVERSQRLMQESRQNKNPLTRKMAVMEVDQEYLDRYAEVLRLRREIRAEFGRMLGDDPRLLSRYIDILRRRRASMREQLGDLQARQEELTQEVSGWLRVDEAQRADLWKLIAELRLQLPEDLNKQAAEMAERTEKQLPLELEATHETVAKVLKLARQIAVQANGMALESKKLVDSNDYSGMVTKARITLEYFSELDATLEQLSFENQEQQEVVAYVTGRVLDCRIVADVASAWKRTIDDIAQGRFHGLAELDQNKLAIATELLRVEMLEIEAELEGQFQQQAQESVPAAIAEMVKDLRRTIEDITYNQAAATYHLSENRVDAAEAQQTKASDGFEKAVKLLDRVRREVADALDAYEVTNPNIADLQDPTLDEFIARLEREPGIQAQLGLPDRPRNLRVYDSMGTQAENGMFISAALTAAKKRALDASKESPEKEKKEKKEADHEMSEEEKEQLAQAKTMQETLEKTLTTLLEQAEDPNRTSQERQQIADAAENMRRMLDQLKQGDVPDDVWEKLAQSEQARAMLAAIARGERIPDEQWNKLLSTLDEGLWQVRGRKPPEGYRKSIQQYQERIRQVMNASGD